MNYTPIALSCDSFATGFCNEASSTNPPAAMRSEYSVRTRSELGAYNWHGTETYTLVVNINGQRNAESMDTSTVSGHAMVTVEDIDGNVKDSFKVRIVKKGWKIDGIPVIETPHYSTTLEFELAPCEFVGITCVAEASSTGENGETASTTHIQVSLTAQPGEENPPPPPPAFAPSSTMTMRIPPMPALHEQHTSLAS